MTREVVGKVIKNNFYIRQRNIQGMPIVRIKHQGEETIQEYFERYSRTASEPAKSMALKMLEVVKLLNEIFKETVIYGELSHLSLGLIPESKKLDRQVKVRIENAGLEEYNFISFELPQGVGLWGKAWVQAKQANLEEFERKLLIAIFESKGWRDNEELISLYKKNGVK